MGRRLILITLGLLCVGVAGDDLPPVSIVTSAHFVSASDTVRYMVRIRRHPDNRELRFLALDLDCEPPCVVSSTERELNGEQAAITWYFERRLPVGSHLLLVAQVLGVNGRQVRATHPLCVYDLLTPCGGD